MKGDIPFLSLSRTTSAYAAELKKAAARVIDSGHFLGGGETEAFESEMSALHAGAHCVGTSNGLDSLRLIFRAMLELGKLTTGDRIIVPGGTYIASVLPLTEFGFRPVFIDSDPRTLNMDPVAAIRGARSARAILTVHLYGNPCWHPAFVELARERELMIIEDNAQSIGAHAAEPGLLGQTLTGTLGHAAAFSFYPTKNVGALGDAGAVVTPDQELAATVRALANYGSDRRYHNIFHGYNCRLDELQAAFLRVKLRHLDEETLRRGRIAGIYSRAITNPQIVKPHVLEKGRQVWHQYIIRCDRRDELRRYLADRGIGTDVHYEVSPTRQPCYSVYTATPLPQVSRLCATMVSLPIGSATPDEAERVAETVNSFV